MNALSTFYVTAAIAVLASISAITRKDAMHGILYLVITLIASAIMFFILGAPFAAALQVIVYAGAIIILFLFVVMMVNPQPTSQGGVLTGWVIPVILLGTLAVLWFFLLRGNGQEAVISVVDPGMIGETFFKKYAFALHLVAIFLLVGLVGAYHIGSFETGSAEKSGNANERGISR